MKLLLSLFSFLLVTSISHSQTKHIKGFLTDSTQTKRIQYAKVILINLENSELIQHQTTNKEGEFEFKDFELTSFRISIQHPNFEAREFYYIEENPKESYEINNLVMHDKGKNIDEITIFAYKDPVHFKGDTLVYIADSFKVRPNAVVEDLLKKLPGITVEKDGSIKSQGKNIARVFVDGDEFFGSDATLATKNLAASSIEKVQVYETDLPDAQAGDEKVQVLDLRLKDEAKKGYFGKAQFGTDFTRFFEGQFLVNRFTNKQKISLFFMGTNTTNTALSWQDANQYNIENQNAYKYNDETDSWEANENYLRGDDGFPFMMKGGVFYSEQVSKKLKLSANYTYSDLRKRTQTVNENIFFLSDTTFYNQSESNSLSKSFNHELNLKIEYKIDSTQTLTIEPKFKISNVLTNNTNFSNYLNSDKLSSRYSSTKTDQDRDMMNIKMRVMYEKKFKKEKRALKVSNNFVYDDSKSEQTLGFNDVLTLTGSQLALIDQQKKTDRNILSNVFQTVFTEPLSKKFKLELTYELFNTTNEQDRFSYNNIGGNYDELDSLTSGQFKSIKMQHKLKTAFIYDYKKHSLTLGATGRYVAIDNQNHFNDTNFKQNVADILPNMLYIFRISRNKKLQITFNTNSTLPDIQFLQPVVNNIDPNRIIVGNPNLRPSYDFNLNTYYNSYNPLSGFYLNMGIYGNYGINQIVSDYSFDSMGRTRNFYMNGNTFSYAGLWGNVGIPIIKQVLTLDPSIQYNQSNRINYVEGVKNLMNTYNISPDLSLNLYTEVVEATIGVDLTWSQAQNTISKNLNLSVTTFDYNAGFRTYLPWKMEFASEVTYKVFKNFGDQFNRNLLLWNMEIKQKFGQHENWSLGVTANDILNQNTLIRRDSFANQVIDSRSLIIARYFMLNLSYKFNSTYKKAKNDKKDESISE